MSGAAPAYVRHKPEQTAPHYCQMRVMSAGLSYNLTYLVNIPGGHEIAYCKSASSGCRSVDC